MHRRPTLPPRPAPLRRYFPLWLPLLWLALAIPAPSGAVVLDRVAAVVGTEAITVSELDERWRELELHPEIAGPDAPRTRAELLNRLIDLKVQMARARELGIQIRPEEVEDTIRHLMADNGLTTLAELSAALAQDGRTIEQLRQEITAQLTRIRVIQREITAKLHLSDEALKEYYDSHLADFARDRQVRLRQIVFSVSGADEADQARVVAAARELRGQVNGRDAFMAAEARLKDTPGMTVGEAGRFGQKDLRPELAQVLFALKPGQVSPPMALPGGVGLFLVEDATAGDPVPFTDALPVVRDRLTAEKTEAAIPDWLASLKRDTHIEVRLTEPRGTPAGGPQTGG
jgi:peptidyl-prolyl cis-trans isomerase SurA